MLFLGLLCFLLDFHPWMLRLKSNPCLLLVRAEVTKALQARRQEKMRRCKEVTDHHHRQPQTGDSAAAGEEQRRPSDHQVITRSAQFLLSPSLSSSPTS